MRCFGQVTSTNRLSRFSRDVFLHIFYNILREKHELGSTQ